ncbi:MAG: PEGA domain-containing protein, partial [Deltaproteobacteria bacterium]|nr:PEGA domain-containing protein [Deltaproteobacteria bacterium]
APSAPPPPPAPDPVKAAPTKAEPPKPEPTAPVKPVTLAVDTTPRGAGVFEDGKQIGTTPLRLERPPAAGTVHLVAKLAGYQDLVIDVPGDASVDRLMPMVKIEAKKTRPTKTPGNKTGSEDRNAGVNPFD